jgi:hypothetical protein
LDLSSVTYWKITHLNDYTSIAISLFEVRTPYSPVTSPFEAPALESDSRALTILPAGIHAGLYLREGDAHFHHRERLDIIVDPKETVWIHLVVRKRDLVDRVVLYGGIRVNWPQRTV